MGRRPLFRAYSVLQWTCGGYKVTTAQPAVSSSPPAAPQPAITSDVFESFVLPTAAMFYKTSMLAGLMATTVLGHAVHKRDTFGCGAPEPSEALLETARQMSLQEQAVKESGLKMAQAAISVPTWFHVVAASQSEEDGYVSVSADLQISKKKKKQ